MLACLKPEKRDATAATRTITPLGALDESRDDSALLRRTTTAEGVTRAAVPASGAHAQAALLDASRSQNPASRDSVGSGRRSVRLEIDPPAIVRPTSKRRVAAMIGGVAALATVGVVGTLWLARPHTAGPQVQYVSAAGAATPTGTLELSILPTDAKITISGLPSHVGSPWRVQLEPGVHQIEIHREGYMAWLTSADILAGQELPLRITLEPLGVKVIDANPTLALTAPPGHEVLLDGVAVASTAIRNSLTVGTHTIALRKHGVEIWQTQLDAKASAVYDLTPILNKQAEQHATDEASAGSAGAPNGEIDMAAPAEPASSPPAAAPEDAAPSAVK
ncbi:MAG TPA: PEGA domain-containing protein [Kofleriaceae bacterium]|nr:PEGA domain-containing protein [Kofleriaceae bacterium]